MHAPLQENAHFRTIPCSLAQEMSEGAAADTDAVGGLFSPTHAQALDVDALLLRLLQAVGTLPLALALAFAFGLLAFGLGRLGAAPREMAGLAAVVALAGLLASALALSFSLAFAFERGKEAAEVLRLVRLLLVLGGGRAPTTG